MTERDTQPAIFYVDRTKELLAYCPDCQSMIFCGSNRSTSEHRILKEQILNHLDFFTEEHSVDIIHPQRKSRQVEDAGDYIAAKYVLVILPSARRS